MKTIAVSVLLCLIILAPAAFADDRLTYGTKTPVYGGKLPAAYLSLIRQGDRQFNEYEMPAAEEAYSRAIGVYDKDGAAYLARAMCYSEKAKYAAALNDVTSASKFPAYGRDAFLMRATIHTALKQDAQVVNDLKDARTAAPNDFQCLHMSATVALAHGDLKTATECANQILKVKPSSPASNIILAKVFEKQSKLADAVKQLDLALGKHADVLDAHRMRANLLEKLGKKDLAAAERREIARQERMD